MATGVVGARLALDTARMPSSTVTSLHLPASETIPDSTVDSEPSSSPSTCRRGRNRSPRRWGLHDEQTRRRCDARMKRSARELKPMLRRSRVEQPHARTATVTWPISAILTVADSFGFVSSQRLPSEAVRRTPSTTSSIGRPCSRVPTKTPMASAAASSAPATTNGRRLRRGGALASASIGRASAGT